ncbi:MAG: glycerate kinase [Alicyclobacillus sp.]|nr:glycerate kinase [Alicyclobacillus sp.]
MRFVIAPDSFKGSLTAADAAEVVAAAVRQEAPAAEVCLFPMADGGEGTVAALVAATGGYCRSIQVTGPLLEPLTASLGVLGDGCTAVVEVAGVAGLTQVPEHRRNPELTSSRGLGEALREALRLGYRRVLIGLGGSACNDGGLGMLTALGLRATDAHGADVTPTGAGLQELAALDPSGLDPRLAACELVVACDVTNPLCGPEGASAVFGPQKGATPEQVQRLDAGLRRWADRIEAWTGRPLRNTPGAGAAGGLGFALLALGARLQPGARLVAEANGLASALQPGDWVITGEGCSDSQTLRGKVPYWVAWYARQAGARPVLLSGSLGPGAEALWAYFISLHAAVTAPVPLAQALAEAPQRLAAAARNVVRLIRAASAADGAGPDGRQDVTRVI